MTHVKRILAVLAAPAFLLLLAAGAAKADVFVTAHVDKTKTLTVDETVEIHKFAFFVTFDFVTVDSVAEQDVVKNQTNSFNSVTVGTPDTDESSTLIDSSVQSANGIVLINQASGFINNQGNEVGVTYAKSPGNTGYRPVPSPVTTTTYTLFAPAVGEPADCTGSTTTCQGEVPVGKFVVTQPLSISSARQAEVDHWATATAGVFAHAQVDVEQVNGRAFDEVSTDQVVEAANSYVSSFSTNSDDIEGSFSDGSGVVGVNQASGHINNQNNALAIAVGEPAVYALGEADLGQFNTFQSVEASDDFRSDTIASGTLSGFAGVAMVNQSSGSMNNQANAVDIAVTNTATLPTFGH
jgi:hypothetical protein